MEKDLQVRMMMDAKGCPTCSEFPKVSNENRLFDLPGKDVVLRCERHGYSAQGDTLEQAIAHWNIFVDFILAEESHGA